jgi:hypothetical protein
MADPRERDDEKRKDREHIEDPQKTDRDRERERKENEERSRKSPGQ